MTQYLACYDKVYNLQNKSYIYLYRTAMNDTDLLEDLERGYSKEQYMESFISYYNRAEKEHMLDSVLIHMNATNKHFIKAYWDMVILKEILNQTL